MEEFYLGPVNKQTALHDVMMLNPRLFSENSP